MKRILAISLALLLALSILPVPASAAADYVRLSGSNRYGTAVEVSKAGWDYSGTVVLARGDDYADALAGVPLAYALDSPILLTQTDRIPDATFSEIQRLGAYHVIILGGEGAVSAAVEETLVDLGLTVERIYGNNRYGTAAAIAAHDVFWGASTAFVAYGEDFPDALSAAAYAAVQGAPILLSQTNRLPDASLTALSGFSQTYVIGGTGVIADSVLPLLPNPIRIAGSNRSGTAVELARKFQPYGGHMFVATGNDFADAITGAVLAAREGSGILLVGSGVSTALQNYLKEEELDAVRILGGPGIISDALAVELVGIASIVGRQVEMVGATSLSLTPGGPAVRYPYAGYVASVLDVSGGYVKLKFGSKTGWVSRSDVVRTDSAPDYIRLGWHRTAASDTSFIQQSPDESGYNVFAPVMYYVGSSGLIQYTGRNHAANIAAAREMGYQNWLTIQHMGSSPNFKEEVIGWIIDSALALDVDGINMDYEALGEANQAGYSAFIQKLYAETRKHDLALSVCVTRHERNRYGLSYDREALGKVTDYLVLMAYDEHWSTSPQEGSVASHPWTRRSVELLLEEVPAEKIILGIPFYTRNWVLNDITILSEDSVIITEESVRVRTEPTTENGSETVFFVGEKGRVLKYADSVQGESISGDTTWYKVDLGDEGYGYITRYYSRFAAAGEVIGAKRVSSINMGQRATMEIVDNYDPVAGTSSYYSTVSEGMVQMYNVDISYDEESGQNVVTWTNSDGVLNKLWLEDAMSLHKRILLMKELGLSGLAAWSLDWMEPERQLWNMFVN